jgi:type I restriction enzyme S subunit
VKPFVVLERYLDKPPPGWQVVALRRASRLIEDENRSGTAPLLSLTIAGELNDRADSVQPPSAEYLLKYGLVQPGDLVVNPMWLAGGSIGVSETSGAVSPEYRIYRFDASVEPRFVHHLLRSDPYMRQYRLLVRAETTFDRRVTKDDFRDLPLLLPPPIVQGAIAEYLDAETVRIDALVAAKRLLQRLLMERIEAWTNAELDLQAERHGVTRIGALCERVVDCVNKTAPTVEYETPYKMIRTSNVKRGVVSLDDVQFVDATTFSIWNRRGAPRRGDVLLTREAPLGEVGLLEGEERVFLGQRIVLYRPNEAKARATFLIAALRSRRVQEQISLLGAGSLHEHLRVTECLHLRVPATPPAEQDEFLSRLANHQRHEGRAIALLEEQLRLSLEHRRALITGAVTGARDIPGVAA